MKIGLNGSVMEASEAVISVYDHGFLYGMGLFETFRTYGGNTLFIGSASETAAVRLRAAGHSLSSRFGAGQQAG